MSPIASAAPLMARAMAASEISSASAAALTDPSPRMRASTVDQSPVIPGVPPSWISRGEDAGGSPDVVQAQTSSYRDTFDADGKGFVTGALSSVPGRVEGRRGALEREEVAHGRGLGGGAEGPLDPEGGQGGREQALVLVEPR